jgi:hypothetical protein
LKVWCHSVREFLNHLKVCLSSGTGLNRKCERFLYYLSWESVEVSLMFDARKDQKLSTCRVVGSVK